MTGFCSSARSSRVRSTATDHGDALFRGQREPVVSQGRQGRAITDADILSSLSPMGHPVGTCAMGADTNAESVVDQNFRVYGTHNLFVVDASVMPVIPSANTNLPTIMLAEMAAERLQRMT